MRKPKDARRMNAPNSLADADTPIITDASVIINLNATGEAAAIIRAFPNRFVVTASVRRELSVGTSRGHACGEKLEDLIGQGVISLVKLGPAEETVYRSLVAGRFETTLDDGEAATIAYAVGQDGIALIDERKARRICAARFPDLRFLSTVEVLLHPFVTNRLGDSGQSDVLFLALRDARMHVPRDILEEVAGRIGAERAAQCSSLPRLYRDAGTVHP